MAKVQWSGDRQVRQNMAQYAKKVKEAETRVAQYWAAVFEDESKRDAPWTDRTANARQALRGYVSDDPPQQVGEFEYPNPNDLAKDTVAIYLSHGMHYGIFLETKNQGQYAIILPTLQRHYSAISRMLQDIFK